LYETGFQYLYRPSTKRMFRQIKQINPDIINLHWTHGNYISHTILPKLSRYKPLIWTFHDMWPLTGHCAYSYDCDRWKTGCTRCPYLSESPPLKYDRAAFLWHIKKKIYGHAELDVVAPSKWLTRLASGSPLLDGCKFFHVPNGLDVDIFKPIPKDLAKKALNLPISSKVLLFVCGSFSLMRKGGKLLIEALIRLRDKYVANGNGLLIMTVGRDSNKFSSSVPFPCLDLGVVSSEHMLTIAYSAADIMINPSMLDNFPSTILESIACGTPVVAFDVGGIPDLVREEETGYLATPFDTEDLARKIEMILSDKNLWLSMSQQCRKITVAEYSLLRQAKSYLEVYDQAINRFDRHIERNERLFKRN